MENIGNIIQKMCYWLAGILIFIGIIASCIVANEVCGEYGFYWEYDFLDASVAFWSSFAVYFGFGFGVFCFGTLFGYLNKICDLLEDIKKRN